MFMLRRCRLLVCGLIVMSAAGCTASSVLPASPSPTAPTPAPTPAPSGAVANIAGNWIGTFESANLGTQTISMLVVQFDNCVDGSWKSTTNDWTGAISGFAGKDSYTGQVSLERSASSPEGACSAIGTISGEVGIRHPAVDRHGHDREPSLRGGAAAVDRLLPATSVASPLETL